jgi:tRNA (Thr-GGU) A37 N-methylase
MMELAKRSRGLGLKLAIVGFLLGSFGFTHTSSAQVAHLEALEGTPILDIKPILPADPTDR